MGSGRWSTDVYSAAANYRAASGTSAFAYSDSGARKAHPALDPKGVTERESRDSDEHPQSTPIAVLFDVTGSMGGVPRVLQTKLPQLLGLLTRKGYADRPAHHVRRGRRRHLRPGAAAGRPVRVGQPDGRGPGPDRAGGRRWRAEEGVVRTGHVLHGPAHVTRLGAEARPARLPVPDRRRDAVPAGEAEGGQEVHRRRAGRADLHRGASSPSCSARSTSTTSSRPRPAGAATRRSWRGGVGCSART